MVSKRDAKRAKRIIEKISLGEVLSRYHYVIDSSNTREQQFRCDLHGFDHKPSARFYPQTNSTYCWVCHKSRDSIDYVREKENVSFSHALDILEKWFHLTPLPWEEEEVLDEEFVFPEVKGRTPLETLESLLMILTRERVLDMNHALKLWSVFDILQASNNQIKANEVLLTVKNMIISK